MTTHQRNSFGTKSTLSSGGRKMELYSLPGLQAKGLAQVERLPYSLKIMLENLLRHEDGKSVTSSDIESICNRSKNPAGEREIAFRPARVLMQDFTGVPAVVDLATLRDAIRRLGGDPARINPLQPVDLVIDHSVQVDQAGNALALSVNAEREFDRNQERYAFLKWGQRAFANFRVVPPDTGIVHQVNLEYLACVVFLEKRDGIWTAYPDTVVGTDSHTTMINGLGVLGWGVGGIEAEAAMLGQPMSMLIPEVLGVRLMGELPAGTTSTDLVLAVTQILRAKGVVGKFVEFCGPGLSQLPLPDRATIANMSPEYGATMGYFPVDQETLDYLRLTGRDPATIELVERYTKDQGLFRTAQTQDPLFTEVLELDLGTIEPSLAGPRRPQDRVPLHRAKADFRRALTTLLAAETGKLERASIEAWIDEGGSVAGENLGPLVRSAKVAHDGHQFDLKHGSVVIAAITSCTNTSNPSVMIAAGLLAKRAVEKGLSVKPWVKASLAPGSKVVTEYLRGTGLLQYLEALRFHIVGYGCTTCIGNSGPLPDSIRDAIKGSGLVAAAVLSGNRNFEGRINPSVRANYLASPPLVVAYAIAGDVDKDLYRQPLGHDPDGRPVFLKDIWPDPREIQDAMERSVRKEIFQKTYQDVFTGEGRWAALESPGGDLFEWDESSTYVRRAPFLDGIGPDPPPLKDLTGARALAVLGDSVTTDHISPAGSIPPESPAGQYLISRGIAPKDFNSYGSRRGNHEVMVRGTFANIRLLNQLAPDTEGGWTTHLPDGQRMTIFDASVRYAAEGVPLIVIAGKEYGSGSSRDWAAKGPNLLGVRAVIAESFERIHRSNLIGMGILPLQFLPGENRQHLGITGYEQFEIDGIRNKPEPGQRVIVRAGDQGTSRSFEMIVRLDTPVEVEYYRHGGILPYVLRQLLKA